MVFCFKQKTAYEMRISDWSSDVCSSDLHREVGVLRPAAGNDALSERLTGAFLRGQCDERYAAQVNLRPNALPRFLEGTGLHLNRNLADLLRREPSARAS